jgi:hypothetical protein
MKEEKTLFSNTFGSLTLISSQNKGKGLSNEKK